MVMETCIIYNINLCMQFNFWIAVIIYYNILTLYMYVPVCDLNLKM